MKCRRVHFLLAPLAIVAAVASVIWQSPTHLPSSRADDPPEKAAARVVAAETYNAVTKVHFTNVAVHKGSPEPNPVKRRFQVDLKYWLMDARYYDKGALSIGNPELVEFVRKHGGKSLPASEPTTLSSMAYGIARAVLGEYPIVQKVEVRLVHFSKGLEVEDETADNHVVNIVVQR